METSEFHKHDNKKKWALCSHINKYKQAPET